MYSLDTLRKLYKVCGYRLGVVMAHRIADEGSGAKKLADELFLHGGFGQSGEPAQNAQVYERKMWRAKRVAHLIAALPFVRSIAVCNSLAFHMAHKDSDVDFFIVAAPGHVWSARWWVTGVLALLRLRPGEAYRDPICVSFFIDETVTDLSSVQLDDDVYFHYWIKTLLPMYGAHPLFTGSGVLAPDFRVRSRMPRILQRVLEFFAKFISEKFVYKQQMLIMPKDLRAASESEDSSVVLSDVMIKLHDQDRRKELRGAVFSEKYL